jgi:actin-related protein 3
MFQHFGNRLKRDLKQLVDRRLDASVLASGGVLKVRISSFFPCLQVYSPSIQSSGVEVDVISHKRQR